jgi:uncharacterized membrane protein
MKEGIAWQLLVQLVITPTSCACVGVLFLYEQKLNLLDKVVNVFTHKGTYKLSDGSFILFIKILPYLVGCFYRIFLFRAHFDVILKV